MPSAASAKLEKQVSGNQTESSDNNNSNTPIRQALVIIEHKIRNLEKRKTKLESYRAIQLSGKELSSDQKAAVSKYDEVAQSLEFARELSKQMLQLATTAEKEQKKQARREVILRAQAETVKIREVLTIQNILSTFLSDSQIREDFLSGTNGATKLEEDDLKILEKFYDDIQVKRQKTPEDVPFLTGAQKAAEYLSLTIDGRPKQYGGTTFDNVRRILNTIQECGYLDKGGNIAENSSGDDDDNEESLVTDVEQNNDQGLEDDKMASKQDTGSIQESAEKIDGANLNISNQQIQQSPQSQQQQQLPQHSMPPLPPQSVGQQQVVDNPKFTAEAPSAAAVPAPSFPQQPQQQQQQSQQPPTASLVNTQLPSQPPPPQMPIPVVPSQMVAASVAQPPQVAQGPPAVVQPNPAAVNPLHAGHYPPTTVRAVEQAYYKQHQYIQQMRPLAEVIGTGSFFFLQDSEIDSPDLVPTTGFNEVQSSISAAPNSTTAGNMPVPNQSAMTPQVSQQQSQQGQLPNIPAQTGGVPQQQPQKTQQQAPSVNSAPIPTQTFTNQSFPPIVPPPSAIFPPQAIQNPNEIPSSQPQLPAVFASPPLPIPQMVGPGVVATQQPVVISGVAVSGAGSGSSSQSAASVLKSIENQQQQGIITSQQPPLITSPSGASVPLPTFTGTVPSKFTSAPAPTIVGIHQVTNQQSQSQQEGYEKLQKPSQKGAVLNDSQIHHKKIEDVTIAKERNEVSNDWNANEKLPKPQRVAKKDEESNQWSNDVITNNVKTNEWSNSSYDNHQTVESNNWNSNNNQNDGSGSGGGYSSRGRNSFGGNNRAGGSSGPRGMRGSGSGNGGGPGSGGPPSNGYRGGRSNNSYQQQQQQPNNRNSGIYFRNSNENTAGGSGYYQNHQNGGYNAGSGGGKQDSNAYSGGNMNTGYRPRGGPIPPSNRQTGGSGNRSSGGGSGSSNSGGPPPQRSSMNTNRPPSTAGGGMSVNTNRPGGGGTRSGNYGNSRPPNVRQHQHQQPQQDVNV